MSKISEYKEVKTQIDEEGNEISTIIEKTHRIESNTEPDYIKLYTNMWCEFNNIPVAYRALFLAMVTMMSYADRNDLEHSQIVPIIKPYGDKICKQLGWTSKDSLMKGLKVLCNCKAIRKVARGVYQINPSYAGKGEWKYNPKLQRGGVIDLVASFNFKEKSVDTKIVWEDDGKDNEINEMFREALGTKNGKYDSVSLISEINKRDENET